MDINLVNPQSKIKMPHHCHTHHKDLQIRVLTIQFRTVRLPNLFESGQPRMFFWVLSAARRKQLGCPLWTPPFMESALILGGCGFSANFPFRSLKEWTSLSAVWIWSGSISLSECVRYRSNHTLLCWSLAHSVHRFFPKPASSGCITFFHSISLKIR